MALSSTVISQAWAQDAEVGAPPLADGGARTGTWIEPRITLGATYTNNGLQSAGNPVAEQILEVSPGVRMVLNSARASGFFDYSLSALYYAQGTDGDNFRNSLNANLTFEAVSDRVFLDVGGVVSDEVVSAFGNQAVGSRNANRAQTSSFRVSPYVRGNLAEAASYELRYGIEQLNTAEDARSDITVQDLSLRLRSDLTGQTLGWLVDATMLNAEYSLGRNTRSDEIRGGLLYAVNPQLVVTALAGVESNNVITIDRTSYSTTGLDLDWRPSERTRLRAGVQKRYFGTGHNVEFEHRTGRTVWRFTDARDVASNPLDPGRATLGSIYDLLDNLYSAQEPDPVRRAQLVQAELLRLGLPADASGFDPFLTSSATLNRTQQFSVALIGLRDVLTFSVARGSTSRLGQATNVGDDFDTNDRVLQKSWGVTYSHRLTPITTYTAGLSWQKSQGTLTGVDNRLNSFSLGMTTQLGLRTSGSLQFVRAVYDQVGSSYGESSISAFITHRF